MALAFSNGQLESTRVETRPSYLVGLDLGTVDDYTALAIVEARDNDRQGQAGYVVSHLERWRHVGYPRIAEEVLAIMRQPPLDRGADLLVDATGVGLPVLQMLRRMGLQSARGITITGGDQVGRNAAGFTVPKANLISALSVVLQTRRLKVAPRLPAGQTLASEMGAFTRRQNAVTGHNQFAVWREGEHDDLVLAVSLPIWRAECSSRVRYY